MSEEPKKSKTGIITSLVLGFGSATAILMSAETTKAIVDMLGTVSQSQVAQGGFFFTLASLIHSARVKKEIRANFEGLTMSIDKLSSALRDDLKSQSDKLDSHENKLDLLTSRVDKLEKNKTTSLTPQLNQ